MASYLPRNIARSAEFEAFLDNVRHDPKSVAIFSDFDGTLSHLIDNPGDVVPVDGVVEVMNKLSESFGTVGVISGRPVSFVSRFFEDPIVISGLYGIEHRSTAGLVIHPEAQAWSPVLNTVIADSIERFGVDVVEDKGLSITLHYRNQPADVGKAVEQWAEHVADEHGLHARSAKKSVEIHPAIERNKADAISDMLNGLNAAIYFGDDVGDLPAFELLTTVVEDGTLKAGATVLVNGSETPAELQGSTTDEVSSPEQVLQVLADILEASR